MSWLARAASQAKNFTSGAGSHTRIGWPDGAHPCVALLVDSIEFGGLDHDFVPDPFERVQHRHSLALEKIPESGACPPHTYACPTELTRVWRFYPT